MTDFGSGISTRTSRHPRDVFLRQEYIIQSVSQSARDYRRKHRGETYLENMYREGVEKLVCHYNSKFFFGCVKLSQQCTL